MTDQYKVEISRSLDSPTWHANVYSPGRKYPSEFLEARTRTGLLKKVAKFIELEKAEHEVSKRREVLYFD